MAPEKIVATKFDRRATLVAPAPGVSRIRPRRSTTGSAASTTRDSFTCQTPELQERNVGAGDLLHALNALRQRELLLPNR